MPIKLPPPVTLTPEVKKNFQDSLPLIDFAKGEILKAKSAGLDVAELEKKLQERERQVKGILRVYA